MTASEAKQLRVGDYVKLAQTHSRMGARLRSRLGRVGEIVDVMSDGSKVAAKCGDDPVAWVRPRYVAPFMTVADLEAES